MPEAAKQEIKLFYCYAHEDKALRDELELHLSNLNRQYHLTNWHDREILPGENWEQIIDAHLSTATVILLLISPHFMASDYCYGKEMARALEREKAGTCNVLPVLLRPTDWEDAPFSYLQMLPTDARPVTSWSDRDQAFWDVAIGIRAVVKSLLLNSGHRQPNEQVLTSVPVPLIEKRNLNVIDLSIEAALEIGADKHPIFLTDLHNAYLRANPGNTKATNRNSFDAIINYRTINMRSRFSYPNDKRKLAPWLSRPVFKRVARARYMLLSPSEVTLFRQRVEEDDPRIYQDEYDVDDLKQPQEGKDKKSDIGSLHEKNKLLEVDKIQIYRNIDLRKFREAIARYYSIEEYYLLAVDLGLDMANRKAPRDGDNPRVVAQGFIEACTEEGVLDELISQVLNEHPDLANQLEY